MTGDAKGAPKGASKGTPTGAPTTAAKGAGAAPVTVELDVMGLKCPLPALRTRKALAALPPGGRLVVLCTDPMTVIDIPHVAQETGAVCECRTVDTGRLTFTLRKRG